MSGFLNRCLFENGYIPTYGDKIRFINKQSGFIYDKVIPPPPRYVTFKGDAAFNLTWGESCKFIASNDMWQTTTNESGISSRYNYDGYHYVYLIGTDTTISDQWSYIGISPQSSGASLHVSVSGHLSALGGDLDVYRTNSRRYASWLFYQCEAITDVSDLIISSSIKCSEMFNGCINLENTPTIEYESLSSYPLLSDHFYGMFRSCSSLEDASGLAFPDVQLSSNCYAYMFSYSGLVIPPALESTNLASLCYDYMFSNCSSLKVSDTQTEDYTEPFRIPSTGTVSSSVSIGSNIFYNTGGTYTSNPVLNETYYLDISAYNPPK